MSVTWRGPRNRFRSPARLFSVIALATNCLPTWCGLARLTAIAFAAPSPPGGLPAPGEWEGRAVRQRDTCIVGLAVVIVSIADALEFVG